MRCVKHKRDTKQGTDKYIETLFYSIGDDERESGLIFISLVVALNVLLISSKHINLNILSTGHK